MVDMTPDQDLSARLCPRCGKPLIDPMTGITFGGKEHITCPPPEGWPEREQTITLADHERAVQAAVAKAVADGDVLAAMLKAALDVIEGEGLRGDWSAERAAIRSRGVAG